MIIDCTDAAVVNETEEWFYQLKGAMLLRIVENNAFRDIHIKEGEMFMLPGKLVQKLVSERGIYGAQAIHLIILYALPTLLAL